MVQYYLSFKESSRLTKFKFKETIQSILAVKHQNTSDTYWQIPVEPALFLFVNPGSESVFLLRLYNVAKWQNPLPLDVRLGRFKDWARVLGFGDIGQLFYFITNLSSSKTNCLEYIESSKEQ